MDFSPLTPHFVAENTELTLRDWFAIHAPLPTEERIDLEKRLDHARNPHNDPHKPKIREVFEIIADCKYEFADAMISARKC